MEKNNSDFKIHSDNIILTPNRSLVEDLNLYPFMSLSYENFLFVIITIRRVLEESLYVTFASSSFLNLLIDCIPRIYYISHKKFRLENKFIIFRDRMYEGPGEFDFTNKIPVFTPDNDNYDFDCGYLKYEDKYKYSFASSFNNFKKENPNNENITEFFKDYCNREYITSLGLNHMLLRNREEIIEHYLESQNPGLYDDTCVPPSSPNLNLTVKQILVLKRNISKNVGRRLFLLNGRMENNSEFVDYLGCNSFLIELKAEECCKKEENDFELSSCKINLLEDLNIYDMSKPIYASFKQQARSYSNNCISLNGQSTSREEEILRKIDYNLQNTEIATGSYVLLADNQFIHQEVALPCNESI
jgi:hypothetical protein